MPRRPARAATALIAVALCWGAAPALAQEARTVEQYREAVLPVFELRDGGFFESDPARDARTLPAPPFKAAAEQQGYVQLPTTPPLWVEGQRLRLNPRKRLERPVCETVGSRADKSLAAGLGGAECR